jgi:hypothetical protein
MKQFILAFLLLSLLSVSSSFTASRVGNGKAETTFVTCKHGQCQATAKSTKKRCKHCVSQSGDKYCWQHK